MKGALSVLLVALALSQVYANNCLTVAGLDMIKSFEGFRPNQYKDVAGIWTIGYGTLCSTGTLKCPGPITEPAAAAELGRAVAEKYAPCVRASVKSAMTDNQYSALISFAYNAGCGALQNVVTATGGKLSGFPARMKLYNKARVNGKLQVVQGLVRRRNAEVALFSGTRASQCATRNGVVLRSAAAGATVPAVAPTTNAAAASAAPGTEFPVHPPANFAAPVLAPATDGRVFAEGEDTGKVNWVRDRPTNKRKMKMGGLSKKKKSLKAKPQAQAQAVKKNKRSGSKASRV